jgi:hypothetical protein
MTDDRQVRDLLALAAELPDDVHPPVSRLLERGRRRRAVRGSLCVGAAAVVALAAFALPGLAQRLHFGQASQPPGRSYPGLFPSHPGPASSGPSAAELSRFRWFTLPSSPLGPKSQPLLAWAGQELIELGGSKSGTPFEGAAYSPGTGRWHRIAQVPVSVGSASAVTAWTGKQLFVVSGQEGMCVVAPGNSGSSCPPAAGLYDPAANRWSTAGLPAQMRGLTLDGAVWTGRDVIVAGASFKVNEGRLGVAAYNPVTGRWRMITPPLPAGHPIVSAAIVATPGRVILWSLWSRSVEHGNGGAVFSGVDVLALSAPGRWSTLAVHWPQHVVTEGPLYAGHAILIPPGQIWCGLCSHPGVYFPAHFADPGTLAQTAVPRGPLVPHPYIEPPIWLWNGSAALAANTTSSGTWRDLQEHLTQLAAYDPVTRSWHVLRPPPGRPTMAANPLWAGPELLLLTRSGQLMAFRH